MIAATLCAILISCAAARAADKYEIRPYDKPGDSWSFDHTSDMRVTNQISADGQVVQRAEQVMHQVRTGTLVVVAARDGIPSEVKVTYARECESVAEMQGQPAQRMPFPFAGQTVTITKKPDGSIGVASDGNGQPDVASMGELRNMLDPDRGMYPKGPIAIGEKWQAGKDAVAHGFNLGKDDDGSMKCELKSIKDVGGRKAAEVAVSMTVVKFEEGVKIDTTLAGPVLVDLETGRIMQADLEGDTSLSTERQMQGPDGRNVVVKVAGAGKATSKSTGKSLAAGAGGGGGGGAIRNVPAPQPQPAAGSMAGSYSGGKVKMELASNDGISYTGTVQLGDKTFPLTARATATGLAGEFESGGNKFPFEATLAGDRLTFKTGGTSHELKKAAANPFEGGGPVNPFGGGKEGARGGAEIKGAEVIAGGQAIKTVADAAATPTPASKDPLAYKVHQLPGGTVATFDNWKIAQVMADASMSIYDTAPTGRESDFVLRLVIATPKAQDLANLFTLAPNLTRQLLAQASPTFKLDGEPKTCKVGGDDALAEAYVGELNGKKVVVRVLYVRRGDIGLAVYGMGSEAGLKEFGRSIEITAQSITFKESAIEPALVGTWTSENASKAGGIRESEKITVASSRSITIYPNSTFTDSAGTTVSGEPIVGLVQGGSRGKIVKRGNMLTFHYDDGNTWTTDYVLKQGAVVLSGNMYLKQ